MSKITLTAEQIGEGFDLNAIFEQFPTISLRKLSDATKVGYSSILKAVKAPIKGVAYDPDALNLIALALLFNKLKVDFTEIDFSTLVAEAKVATVKDLPLVGETVFTRDYPDGVEVALITATHIVFIPAKTTKPISWSIHTFQSNGITKEKRVEVAEGTPEAPAEA